MVLGAAQLDNAVIIIIILTRRNWYILIRYIEPVVGGDISKLRRWLAEKINVSSFHSGILHFTAWQLMATAAIKTF